MKQANYKTLLLKLAGTGVGLVAMLTLAANVGQNLLADKTDMAANSDGYVYAHSKKYSPRYVALDKSRLEAARLKQEQLALATEKWQNIKEFEAARITAEALKLANFESLMDIQIDKLENLSDTIGEITERQAIPEAIKERILAKLDLQLKDTELKLTLLEDQVLKFSFNSAHLKSKYNHSAKCSGDYNLIIKKCDGPCAENDLKERVTKGINKGPLESFYWI